jgi:hypothetical protein
MVKEVEVREHPTNWWLLRVVGYVSLNSGKKRLGNCWRELAVP